VYDRNDISDITTTARRYFIPIRLRKMSYSWLSTGGVGAAVFSSHLTIGSRAIDKLEQCYNFRRQRRNAV